MPVWTLVAEQGDRVVEVADDQVGPAVFVEVADGQAAAAVAGAEVLAAAWCEFLEGAVAPVAGQGGELARRLPQRQPAPGGGQVLPAVAVQVEEAGAPAEVVGP